MSSANKKPYDTPLQKEQEALSRAAKSFRPNAQGKNFLKAAQLNTQIGSMLAIADESSLYLLEFVGCQKLIWELERLQRRTQYNIIWGKTEPLESITDELRNYFEGTLKQFRTPFTLLGTPFQKRVWQKLREIPSGETRSYAQIARSLGQPTAYRAVARANGSNQHALVIPCHRVINTDGSVGGYGGGVTRKEWLLAHER